MGEKDYGRGEIGVIMLLGNAVRRFICYEQFIFMVKGRLYGVFYLSGEDMIIPVKRKIPRVVYGYE
jgi:hypothetical protein